MLTPYQFASNTPIMASDLDGLELHIEIMGYNDAKEFTSRYLNAINSNNVKNNLVSVLGYAKALTWTYYEGEEGYAAETEHMEPEGTQVWYNGKMLADFPDDWPIMGLPAKNVGLTPELERFSHHMTPAEKTMANYNQMMLFGRIYGIVAPFFIGALETKVISRTSVGMCLFKGGLDFGGQLLLNKGNYRETNVWSLGLSVATTPFLSAYYGSLMDIKPFSAGDKISILGANKSYKNFAIDFATKYSSKMVKSSTLNFIKTNPGGFALTNFETNLLDMSISIPTSLSGKSLSYGLKKQ